MCLTGTDLSWFLVPRFSNGLQSCQIKCMLCVSYDIWDNYCLFEIQVYLGIVYLYLLKLAILIWGEAVD